MKIKLLFFIAFHFKTNDQIENVNASYKQFLKTYVNYNQND